MEMTIRSGPKEQRSQPDRTTDEGTLSLPAVASVGRTFVVNVKFAIQSFTLHDIQHTETRKLLINLILLIFLCFKARTLYLEAGNLCKCGGHL